MNILSKYAKIYWIIIFILGIISTLNISNININRKISVFESCIWIFIAAFSGSRRIVIFKKLNSNDECSISISMILTFASLLSVGPRFAVLISTINCVISCIYPKRLMLYRSIFNLSLTIFETELSSMIYISMNRNQVDFSLPTSSLALILAAGSYFVLNTFGVAIIIALTRREKIIEFWYHQFVFTAPSYFASASISALAVLVAKEHFIQVLLIIVPGSLLAYQGLNNKVIRDEEAKQHSIHLVDLYLSVIESLALAVDAKDKYNHQHIIRVQKYAVATAKKLGLRGNDLEGLRTGSLLHDIGKLGIPDYILLKTHELTEEESNKVRKHPEIGASILSPVDFPWEVLSIVKHHHERWDGNGYPDGLFGENIPLTARILAVSDEYDALTSDRSHYIYNHNDAISKIICNSGTHFDPRVVDAFISIIDKEILVK